MSEIYRIYIDGPELIYMKIDFQWFWVIMTYILLGVVNGVLLPPNQPHVHKPIYSLTYKLMSKDALLMTLTKKQNKKKKIIIIYLFFFLFGLGSDIGLQ